MGKTSEIENLFSGIPSLDAIVLAAGTVSRTKPISPEMFRKTLEVNLIAPFYCAELAKSKE